LLFAGVAAAVLREGAQGKAFDVLCKDKVRLGFRVWGLGFGVWGFGVYVFNS